MERTKFYFNDIKKYREEMRRYQQEAENELLSIEQYKGSEGYQEDEKAIEQKRMERVRELQKKTLKSVLETTQDMKKAVLKHPVEAPTPEQESILRVLKMRSNLTVDELQQAENSLKGCPIALSVLQELAVEHGILGFHVNQHTSTNEILESIKSLESFAKTTCQMPRVDNKQEWLKSPKYNPVDGIRTDYFRVDRNFDNEEDCITFAGFVNDYNAFKSMVNA